jgi:hypothetical protein
LSTVSECGTISDGTQLAVLGRRSVSLTATLVLDLHFVEGPLMDSGDGLLVSFDANDDGMIDELDEMVAAIGLPHAQHFEYQLDIRNKGVTGSLADMATLTSVQEGFELDDTGEDQADGCADGVCDGVASDGTCTVTLSGPPAKKGDPDLRYIAIEADSLAQDAVCSVQIFVRSVAGDGNRKGRNSGGFFPTSCMIADTSDSILTDTIPLSSGARVFDEPTNSLLAHIKGIQLPLAQCP